MHISERMKPNLIDVVVLLVGVVLVFTSTFISWSVGKALLEAIGTGSVAASIVAYLNRHYLMQEHTEIIKIAANKRSEINPIYRDNKYRARKVHILSIALSDALREIATDKHNRLLRRVLSEGVEVKLMLLSPESRYVADRAAEDGWTPHGLHTLLTESLEHVKTICARLETLSSSKHVVQNPEHVGSFEIRVIKACPHVTIYRTDGEVLFGLYTSAKPGTESPVFKVTASQGGVFQALAEHFDALWRRNADGYVVRFAHPSKLSQNKELLLQLLKQPLRGSSEVK